MITMTLYHGTDSNFSKIDLSKSFGRRDFGTGFYTTTLSSQAERWALNKKARNSGKHAFVYVYEAEIPESLAVKSFEGLSLEWLEMIRTNRQNGGVQHGYDIVIGPVANDDTMLTVTRFIQGIFTAEEALERLRFSKANDQVSFHTDAAVSCLKLIRRYSVD